MVKMKKLILGILPLILISFGVYAQTAPYFTSTAVTEATEDSPYTYTAAAIDDDGDLMTFSAEVLPSWLLFDDGTQELYGTPTNDHVGDHNVTLRVAAGTDFEEQIFTISVSNTNDPPSITSTAVTTATQDAAYSYDADASDPDPVGSPDLQCFCKPRLAVHRSKLWPSHRHTNKCRCGAKQRHHQSFR